MTRKRSAMACIAVTFVVATPSTSADHSSGSHIVPLLRRAQAAPKLLRLHSLGAVEIGTPDTHTTAATTQIPPAAVAVPSDSTTVPTPSPTSAPEMNSSVLVGVVLGSVAMVLVVLAMVLMCRRRQAQVRAKILFKGGPSNPTTEADDPAKHPRRGGEPFSSVYATDFASSDYCDSHSPNNQFDGILDSDPFRRKDRVKPELDRPAPFFSYYHQGMPSRRSSLESQDSSIMSYTESDRIRGTTTSSAAEETPRQHMSTSMMAHHPPPTRDDSMSSSVTAGYGRDMWGSSFVRSSGVSTSFSSAGIDSPCIVGGGAFSLPEKMTMLDDGASQTSSRESYDI